MKSSWRRPGTNRPLASETVAVTLISSTPLLKRNDDAGGCAGVCCGGGCCAAIVTTDVSAAAAISAARRAPVGASACAFVHMGHDACFRSETDAISRDVPCAGDRQLKRRVAARRERPRVDRAASAPEKSAVAIEHEYDRRHAVDARAV